MKIDINVCRKKCPYFKDGMTVRCGLRNMPNYPVLPENIRHQDVPKECTEHEQEEG
jgi:hypothetical protein